MASREAEAARIFLEAVEHHEPHQWADYVQAAAAGDPALVERVGALLRGHGQSNPMLDEDRLRAAAALAMPGAMPGTNIGPYQLLEQIGEGGFGVVYLAEQQQPVRRTVALKIIKPGMDSKQVIARFEAERQALAMMDHTNIARVLDAGATDLGRPYFVMELVRGIPITQFCDHNRLTPRERLELFVTVCQAVQHAHQKGIIHRDLKPSNVLIMLQDGSPVVKVIDFGIAKALGQQRLTDKTSVTGLAPMIGTPLYMSPEQTEMSGQEADTRTDIYALGVLLYELLTGTTPFDKERLKEASYDEIRRIIREEEPAKPSTRISTLRQAASTVCTNRKSEPRQLSQLFRRELDWIVMKALEKDRNRRYETASGFAADVERYLHDEPVQACTPSALYRLRKFARRNRRVAVMASFLFVMLVVGLAVLGVSYAQVQEALQDKTRALEHERDALQEKTYTAYLQSVALAEREWSANNLGRMEQLLEECPADLRGWEWHYLKRLRYKNLPPLYHDSELYCVAYSPTGQYLASASQDGFIKVWDAHTGQLLRTLRAGEKIVFAFSVAFRPDGQRLVAACSDGTLKFWDLQADKVALDWKAHPNPVLRVAFSPDGGRLASSRANFGWEGQPTGPEVIVWDAAACKAIFTLKEQQWPAFSHDGRLLATAGTDQTVKVWDARTGHELLSWTHGHTAPVRAVAFSPDDRSLASVSGDWCRLSHGEVKLWDAQTGELRLTLRGHIGNVQSVAFSPDGRRLASAGMDKTVKLWDVATGRQTFTLRGHKGGIGAVAFSPDGRQLASAGDRTVRIWDATPLEEKPGEEPLTLHVHPAGVLGVAFHPDSQRLATVADDGGVKLWDSRTGEAVLTYPDSQGCWSVAISPDGQRLTASGRKNLKVWDLCTGQELLTREGFSNVVKRVAFCPDSRHLVSAHWDKTVRVWDAATGEEVRRIPAHDIAIYDLALSPDGKSAATSSADESVRVWDVATGLAIANIQRAHMGVVTCVAFRPDRKVLASGAGTDWTIKFWDTQSWKQQDVLRDPTGGVESLAFSPDSRLLAWGSTDGTVKVWDARTKEIQSLRGHTSWVEDVAFSPDGKWLASASLDGTVKLWPVVGVPEALAPAIVPPELVPKGRE